MRNERWLTGLTSLVLAFSLSLSSVLCLASGFSLTVESPERLVVFCAAASLFCCLLVFPRGEIPVLLGVAFGLGYLWHLGEPLSQTAALITRISRVYNQAYHWGYLALSDTWQSAYCDWPLLFLAGCILLCVSVAVCRGRFTWLALSAALLPFGLCLVVTDTVPSAACLFTLTTCVSILILTAGIRRENRRQAAQLTAMVTVPVLIFCAALFLSFPQDRYVNQAARLRSSILQWGSEIPDRLVNTAGQLTQELQRKSPSELNLSRVGPQRELTYPVMDITSEAGGQIYLREQDFDTYTGTGWLSGEAREERLPPVSGVSDSVTIQTRSRKETLFVPWYPAGGTILSEGRTANEADTAEYTLTRILPETLSVPETGESYDLSRYTQLPEATREKGQSLLYGTLNDQMSWGEKAQIIGSVVASSARYDLNTQRMPEEERDFALWFLSSCDRGYCIHFATAATVLLRSAGIPARYVTGYLVTALPGKTVTVTAGQAHAWAEYYNPETGLWQILEATPEAAPEIMETETVIPAPQEPLPSLPQPVLPETAPVLPAPQEPAPPVSLMPLLTAFLAVMIMVLQRFVRRFLRQRRLRGLPPNRQALLLWQETEHLAKYLGEKPPESLCSLAQKARFSQHTLTEDELDLFRHQILASRLRLKERPWYRRLIDQYWFAAY